MDYSDKIDDVWMSAIIQGTKSREFIESEGYSLWRNMATRKKASQ